MSIISIFISPQERRLRAGWRILAHFLILMVVRSILRFVILPLIDKFNLPEIPNTLIVGIIGLALATLSVYLARRYIDHRSFASLGLHINKQTIPDAIFGFGVAGVVILAIFLVELAAGWLQITGFAWQELSISSIVGFTLQDLFLYGISPGWYEELIERGYRLQNLQEGLNLTWALLISSASFTYAHFYNPNASWISTLGIFLGGYFLAYGWIRTRSLWIPIGLHTGWNFFEGVVFGFPVSGFQTFNLIRQSVKGPQLITGGDFGPEAGLILLPAMALGIILIYFWTKGRKKINSEKDA